MRSTVPSHKGCEAMRREISKKLLNSNQLLSVKNAVAKGFFFRFNVCKKEGVGQVVLIGGPNVGKSLF